MLILFLLLSLFCLPHVLGKLLFGYYDDNLTETPWVSIHQAFSLADANSTFINFNVPSLLLIYDAVFQGSPQRMILQSNWRTQLASLMSEAAPLFASGALTGGDELVWNCLAPSNLTLVADAVRELCPRGKCTVWYNEAAVFGAANGFKDSCGNFVSDFSIPKSLDLFSTDIYHMDGVVEGWVDSRVKAWYEAWIFPNITSEQKVVLVPGSFGSNVNHYPNGTSICDKKCYDVMCSHDAIDFKAWAVGDDRVAGIFPWNWGGCAACNGSRWTPPHTCCMDELGTRVQPLTAASWKYLFGSLA